MAAVKRYRLRSGAQNVGYGKRFGFGGRHGLSRFELQGGANRCADQGTLVRALQHGTAMLKGISPYLSPELLKILAEMGHGDDIVLADANFPGASTAQRLVRADGIPVTQMLRAIMPLFELDSYAAPLVMMDVVEGDALDPDVEADFMRVVREHDPLAAAPLRIERSQFYERAQRAYAVLMTGEARKYGNLILKKGVIGP